MNSLKESRQRFNSREKKRKVNRVLNTMIGIVVIIIICIIWGLFMVKEDEAKNKKPDPTTESKKEEVQSKTEKEVSEAKPKEEDVKKDQKVIITGSTDPNVVEAYKNTGWAPIGTKQSEPHSISYDSKSQDWKEMLDASAYAVDLTVNDFTPLFVGRGPSENKVLSTIGTKDGKYIYRIELQWVEAKGWEPTLVQQLHKNIK